MSRTIYALLIAIDDYPSPIPKLRGCVNDIEAFASYLSERVAGDKGVAIKLKTLKNGEATRQAVVDAFSDHLGKAKKGDVALFYYSGHGSREQAPEEFWKLEPDHLDETLVLFDSRNKGSWDLADKEIAKRRRRNMWAMAIIGGRFRSSSASLSGAQRACQPIATCSPERQPCSPGR